MRKLACLITAVLLLRLNLVAVDLTCAAHEVAASTAVEQSGEHAHAAVMSEQSAPVDASDSCEAPKRADCCDAFLSCTLSLGLTSSDGGDASPFAQATVVSLGADRLASVTDAPEPPPPKA